MIIAIILASIGVLLLGASFRIAAEASEFDYRFLMSGVAGTAFLATGAIMAGLMLFL